MGTFTGDKNAKGAASAVDKDNPTPEQVKAADETVTEQKQIDPANPTEPVEILGESDEERGDRHVASTELPVGDLLPEEQQADTAPAEDAKELIVAGAASGPDRAGVVRNDGGKVAYAPPGTLNAAYAGVQEDAAGHVDSMGTDNSDKSGTRI